MLAFSQVQVGSFETLSEGREPVGKDIHSHGQTRVSLAAVYDTHQQQADLLRGVFGERVC